MIETYQHHCTSTGPVHSQLIRTKPAACTPPGVCLSRRFVATSHVRCRAKRLQVAPGKTVVSSVAFAVGYTERETGEPALEKEASIGNR